MLSCVDWFSHPYKNEYLTGRDGDGYDDIMRCMIPWELIYVLVGNKSQSGILIL